MRESIKDFYYRYLRYFQGKDNPTATSYDKYLALAYAVRSRMVDDWIETQRRYHRDNVRRLYYISNEYVLGKSLGQNIINLGMEESVSEAARDLGFSLQDVMEIEDDFELGNGGKGRLAACLLDSMATLGLPAMGYGIRYDYAQFQQELKTGVQYERPCDWLHKGHPWEILRPEYSCHVEFNGQCVPLTKGDTTRGRWINTDKVIAVPYDLPIPGYRNTTVNTLRLWSSRAVEEFLPDYQHHGDYTRACEDNASSGTISKVLFPEENVLRATEKRLKQQYFLVSASLKDIVRRYRKHNPGMLEFDSKTAIQLNGSRCALAVVELMRILVDEENVAFDDAWKTVRNVFSYTSHAVTKDDLETWPVYLVSQIFPRHMEIIFEINQKHLDSVRRDGKYAQHVADLSLIEEGEVKRVRMAQLAVLGSHIVNGVSRPQTESLKKKVFPAFALMNPDKIVCKTNGVAHRRWLLSANRPLAHLISEAIGDGWITDAEILRRLEDFADDEQLLSRLDALKKSAKIHFASRIHDALGVRVDPQLLFDVQSKKIHPYKRQVLHLFHILWRYLKIKNGQMPRQPRLHVFAGKATPSDHLAKQILHLINVVADLVSLDPQVREFMGIVFLPNYGVAWAEELVPAADLSEQISASRTESCGTSNMKFGFNGAVMVMSRSGSNLEIIEHVGAENVITFGRKEEDLPAAGAYRPGDIIAGNEQLKAIFAFLENHLLSIPGAGAINPLIASLRDSDEYHVLLDYEDYVTQQENADLLYLDRNRRLRTSLMTIARMGWFSSDRLVRDYAQTFWKLTS